MIAKINHQLRANPTLKKQVLDLGYEYYQEGKSQLTLPIRQTQVVKAGLASSSQLNRAPVASTSSVAQAVDKSHLQLGNMPTEVLVNIFEFTYNVEVKQLPSFIPIIHNEPTNRSQQGPAQRRRFPFCSKPKRGLKNKMVDFSKSKRDRKGACK